MRKIDWLKNKVYCLDVRTGLENLPENSIDMIVCSPPYWSLRDYGIEMTVWDGDPNCDHDFEPLVVKQEMYDNVRKRWQHGTTRDSDPDGWRKEILRYKPCKCRAWKGTLGLEPTFELFVKHLCDVFELAKKPLKSTGALWVNLGDTMSTQSGASNVSMLKRQDYWKEYYENQDIINRSASKLLLKSDELPDKCLCMVPARFAIEMCNRGWILRNEIIWLKTNPMPESARDRFTRTYEYIYFFVQNKSYYFKELKELRDEESIARDKRACGNHKYVMNPPMGKVQGISAPRPNDPNREVKKYRKMRNVWIFPTASSSESHFAVFPPELVERPIEATCPIEVCSKCGTPREEIWDRPPIPEYCKRYLKDVEPKDKSRSGAQFGWVTNQHYGEWRKKNPKKLIGYKQCDCGAEFVSGIVLDPFFGTGSTGKKAIEMDRDWIGFDISPKFCQISKRITNEEYDYQRANKGKDMGSVIMI